MTAAQIFSAAEFIVIPTDEALYCLTIEDIRLCFSKAIMGHYGEIYRLDVNIICQWLGKYMDERKQMSEQINIGIHNRLRKQENDGTTIEGIDYFGERDLDGFDRRKKKRDDMMREFYGDSYKG